MGIIERITVGILLLWYAGVFGQLESKNKNYYQWFDQVVGQKNTGLYNGTQYVDLYVNRIIDNKHAYFYSDKPLKGTVTYDNQTYYDVNLRYNMETDQLLVHLKPGEVASILQLIRDKVDNFTINGFRFIKVEGSYENGSPINGFQMVLVENSNLILLKRYTKSKSRGTKQTVGDRTQYKFVSETQYILKTKNGYRDIKSKSDIIENFPSVKKEIRKFFKIYKALEKRDPDNFMSKLFVEIIEPVLSKYES